MHFRRSSNTTYNVNRRPFTIALCITSVEGTPSHVSSVYASLEGAGVDDAAHRTKRTKVDSRTMIATFPDSPLVARVCVSREVRVALRSGTAGTLLGDARLDVRAIATHGTACKLRIPLKGTERRGMKENLMVVSCLALAARGRDPSEETSWDSARAKKGRGVARRREMSDVVRPSATAVDVRRRLKNVLAADRDLDDFEENDFVRERYGSTVDEDFHERRSFSDIDEDSLSGLFLNVDTAKPLTTRIPPPGGRLGQRVTAERSHVWRLEPGTVDSDLDDNVFTYGSVNPVC